METNQHKAAIEEFWRLGASVLTDDTSPKRVVIELDFAHSGATDNIATSLENVSELRNLLLDYTLVTDKVLEVLRHLGQLRQLSITHTEITDRGLTHLRQLCHLELLCLGNNITDVGFEYVKTLKTLKWLDVADTQITELGLEGIGNLAALVFLGLSPNQISDRSVKYLKSLPSLERVNLAQVGSLDAPAVLCIQHALPYIKIEC